MARPSATFTWPIELYGAVDLLAIWSRCVEAQTAIPHASAFAVMRASSMRSHTSQKKMNSYAQLFPAKVVVTSKGEIKLAEFRLTRMGGA